jgi:hypothetical protein
MNRNHGKPKNQHGFTITQMVVTITIIAIVSMFGVLGIKNARAEFRLHNSARLFAVYAEKARADSIRRHAATGNESSIVTFGPGTTNYAVSMDYGSGSVETRTFDLESGLVFMTAAQRVTFDWRGRITVPCDITKACVFQVHSNYLGYAVPVDISGSGDITVGEQHFPDLLIPAVAISDVGNDVEGSTPTPTPSPSSTPAADASPSPGSDPNATPTPTPIPTPTPTPTATPTPTPTPVGNGNGNGSPTPTPTPGATPTPTPISQCVTTLSPSTLSLSQTDETKLSGSATFTMSNATGVRIISASQLGNGNSLNISLSLMRIDGNGSSVITVSTKNGAGNRGVFIVEIAADPACGSSAQQLTVSVTN